MQYHRVRYIASSAPLILPADATEVDADHRHAGIEEALQRAQHGAVAAEHEHEVAAAGLVPQLRATCNRGVLVPLVGRHDE